MRYGIGTDGVPNYVYGGQDSPTSACSIDGLSYTNCVDKFNVLADGSIDGSSTGKYSYAVTTKSWYTGCRNYGSAQWGPLSVSTFDNSQLLHISEDSVR